MTLNLFLSNYFIGRGDACRSASCEVTGANFCGFDPPVPQSFSYFHGGADFNRYNRRKTSGLWAVLFEEVSRLMKE